MADQLLRSRGSQLQDRIRRFTRVEKAFYGSIVLTGIILAVSIIFMQTRILQVQSDLTNLNTELKTKETDEKWYGITYREDLEKIKNIIKEKQEKGEYPIQLWK